MTSLAVSNGLVTDGCSSDAFVPMVLILIAFAVVPMVLLPTSFAVVPLVLLLTLLAMVPMALLQVACAFVPMIMRLIALAGGPLVLMVLLRTVERRFLNKLHLPLYRRRSTSFVMCLPPTFLLIQVTHEPFFSGSPECLEET